MVQGLMVAVYVLVCLFLLIVVLLQQGKGGDIAAAFGGASSQTAFGARAGATVLTRATTILGTLFMLGALALTIWQKGGGGSVVGGIDAPAPTQQAAPALPVTTPPLATPGTQPATPPAQPPAGATPPTDPSKPPATAPGKTDPSKPPVKKGGGGL
jgi:preprotein translocase subunit SecG